MFVIVVNIPQENKLLVMFFLILILLCSTHREKREALWDLSAEDGTTEAKETLLSVCPWSQKVCFHFLLT
jgi:hypothetical protein